MVQSASPTGWYAGCRNRVFYGRGSLANLDRELDASNVHRPLVVTTVKDFPVVDTVRAAVNAEVHVYDGGLAHAPRQTTREALDMYRAVGADGIVAVGGGSAVDVARGAMLLAGTGVDWDDMDLRPELDPVIPFFTVTTTLSQADFNVIAGITNEETGAKTIYTNEALMPLAAILDGNVTAHTPDRLFVGSGVKALETAIIRYLGYGDTQMFLDPALRYAIKQLYCLLPESHRDPANLDVRQRLQLTAWQAFGFNMLPLDSSVQRVDEVLRWGSASRHQLGGKYRAPHGELAGIALSSVLAFNRANTYARQTDLARLLGKDTPAQLSEDLIPQLVRNLGLPLTFGELGLGIDATSMEEVVELMLAEQPNLTERRSEMLRILTSLL